MAKATKKATMAGKVKKAAPAKKGKKEVKAGKKKAAKKTDMKVVIKDTNCVATYQCLEADQLNAALKASGISDARKRRKVIEHFLFDAGYFRDSCWFETERRRFRPVVCFEEVSENGESKGTMLIPDRDRGVGFHEYAHSTAGWLFDEHKDASSIPTGDILAALYDRQRQKG